MATRFGVNTSRQATTTASAATFRDSATRQKLKPAAELADKTLLDAPDSPAHGRCRAAANHVQGSRTATARTPGAVRITLSRSATCGLRKPVKEGVCRACSRKPCQRFGC